MVPQSKTPFTRRDNHDGTFDSICRECFATVATARDEEELRKAEQAHDCCAEERHFPALDRFL